MLYTLGTVAIMAVVAFCAGLVFFLHGDMITRNRYLQWGIIGIAGLLGAFIAYGARSTNKAVNEVPIGRILTSGSQLKHRLEVTVVDTDPNCVLMAGDVVKLAASDHYQITILDTSRGEVFLVRVQDAKRACLRTGTAGAYDVILMAPVHPS